MLQRDEAPVKGNTDHGWAASREGDQPPRSRTRGVAASSPQTSVRRRVRSRQGSGQAEKRSRSSARWRGLGLGDLGGESKVREDLANDAGSSTVAASRMRPPQRGQARI